MPSAPVFSDILTEERPLEVLFYRDTEHLGDTDRDIDTSGKVGVEFKRIEHHDEENIGALEVLGRIDHGIDRGQDTVRDHEFFKISP